MKNIELATIDYVLERRQLVRENKYVSGQRVIRYAIAVLVFIGALLLGAVFYNGVFPTWMIEDDTLASWLMYGFVFISVVWIGAAMYLESIDNVKVTEHDEMAEEDEEIDVHFYHVLLQLEDSSLVSTMNDTLEKQGSKRRVVQLDSGAMKYLDEVGETKEVEMTHG